MNITFDGLGDDAVLADVRKVFLRTPVAYRVMYALIAVGAVAAIILARDIETGLFFVFVASAVIALAYGRPRIAWKQNVAA